MCVWGMCEAVDRKQGEKTKTVSEQDLGDTVSNPYSAMEVC